MNSSPSPRAPSSSCCMPLQVLGVAARDELHVVERGRRGGERDAVDVERLAHAVHDVGDRRVRERVADAQAGQPVGLGEGARDDQVRDGACSQLTLSAAQVGAAGTRCRPRRAPPARARARVRRKASTASGRAKVPVGLFGLAIHDDVGLVVDRARHRLEVVAVVCRRHDDRARAARLRGERIDREGSAAR